MYLSYQRDLSLTIQRIRGVSKVQSVLPKNATKEFLSDTGLIVTQKILHKKNYILTSDLVNNPYTVYHAWHLKLVSLEKIFTYLIDPKPKEAL